MNFNNCYKICEDFYYFDESNEYHCTKTCQGKYNKAIIEKKLVLMIVKMIILTYTNIIIFATKNVQMELLLIKLILNVMILN